MKHSKRYNQAVLEIDPTESRSLQEALALVKERATAKFDETVDLVMNLGIDPRKSDQQVRGTVSLPKGTGRDVRVLVFAKDENVRAAEQAGADFVGGEELVDKIAKENWLDFDVAIATPDMMRFVGKIGRVLGPRGLMPNPKTGTVTPDVVSAIEEFKAGKVEYRTDRGGTAHVAVGKASFGQEDLLANVLVVIDAVMKARPTTAKGTYLKSAFLTSTMGPSVRLDVNEIRAIR